MPRYHVEIDGRVEAVIAGSLAACCNEIRGKGKHIKVWNATSGLQLIDTKLGDAYDLISKDEQAQTPPVSGKVQLIKEGESFDILLPSGVFFNVEMTADDFSIVRNDGKVVYTEKVK